MCRREVGTDRNIKIDLMRQVSFMTSEENAVMSRDDKVCVVIPAYRVESYIQDVIRGIPDWVWRIIVVDDASPDRSAEMAQALNDPRVIVLKHDRNQGVGGAMLTGLNKALELGATVAVKMDGDNQMPPEYLPDLVRPVLDNEADFTKGNRFVHAQRIIQMPLMRRIGNMGLSFLIKLASGYWNVFDPTNGYIAIDMSVFNCLDQSRIQKGYFFESSLLMELNLARAVVVDVPLPACYAGEISSLSIPRVACEFPYLLLLGFFRRIWLQYFIVDFSVGSLFFLVGILLCLFGLIWGGWALRISLVNHVPASTGTVMIAVLPFILGFQLLLQAIVFDVQNVPRRKRTWHGSCPSDGG